MQPGFARPSRRLPASLFASVLAFLPVAGCATAPGEPPIDGAEDTFLADRSASGCLADPAAEEARGVLALANDPAATAGDLEEAGLHWNTAAAVVAARPLVDLEALDRVPTVGPVACARLRDHACDLLGLCEPELSVWTWNLEHFPLTSDTPAEVVAALEDHGVEIVGFQEIDDRAAFAAMLEDLPGWGGFPGVTGFGTQVAIAYRRDRVRVVEIEDLFVGQRHEFPRPPLAVTFELGGRAGAARLTVVVVHLKAQIDAASRARRAAAVFELEEWIYRRRKATGVPILALGDFNDDVDAERERNVFLPFLDRPHNYRALTLDAAADGAISFLPFARLIDHLFATREAEATFPAQESGPVPLDATIAAYRSRVSDHRPVASRHIPILPADHAPRPRDQE